MLSAQLETVVEILHYTSPAVLLTYYLVASIVSICTLQTRSLKVKDQHVSHNVILWLMVGLVGNYMLYGLLLLVRTVFRGDSTNTQHENVYIITSIIVWGIQVLTLVDTKFPVWYTYYGGWILSWMVEVTLVIISYVSKMPNDTYEITGVAIQLARILILVLLPCLYLRLRNRKDEYGNSDAEAQSLLRKKLAPNPGSSEDEAENQTGYGTTAQVSSASSVTAAAEEEEEEDEYLKQQEESKQKMAKRLEADGNWWTYARAFAIFFPYIWPVHSKKLQFRALLVAFCLLATNAMNVLIPRQLGIVTDTLVDGDGRAPWVEVAVYTGLLFANSGGCIGWLQFWLWLPLEQYSSSALNIAAQSHVMNLSSDFHDNKEASDIFSAIAQGGSITDLVETVCFSVLPMFVDLILAVGYIYYLFGPYLALIVASTAVVYIYTTTKLVTMAQTSRRDYIRHWRKQWTMGYAGVDNWQTASYFNNIGYEEQRYSEITKLRFKSDWTYKIAYRMTAAAQGLIMTIGLLGACYLAVYQVLYTGRSPGQFVTLLTYWTQLKTPLAFFSNMYKEVSERLMDAERLLELFQTKPTIIDKKGAKPLKFGKGSISFANVNYAYDERKPALKNLNFEIPGGSTVAFVGETGGGKSTILKLIDRFYDVDTGAILIDGQDLRDITLDSLRSKIGVVPQDPHLSNDTIMNNLRYARLSATDEEVHEACRAAAIHDRIVTWPDGYQSKVGRRGVKLSGGEKQRLAIARAILKQPQIVLLDEATSAVDTETEQTIQSAFSTLCKDRTTFVVAHRLSTIMKADRIMVIMNGEIVEDGTHEDLIHSKGKYHDLWSKQIMVKSAKDHSKSRGRSPNKKDANILNDIDPERPTTTLKTALQTTHHPEPNSEVGTSGSSAKVPKLKPEAPEFFPSHLRSSTEATNESDRMESKQEMKDCMKKEKVGMKRSERQKEKDRAKEEPRSIFSKRKRAEARSSDGAQDSADEGIGSTRLDQIPEDGESSAAGHSEVNKSKLRRPRYSKRRHQSKSEPSGRAQDSLDGTQDSILSSDGLPESFGGTAATQSQRRRVSAPSDPPASGPNDMRVSALGGRVKRTRHWRAKNRAAEEGSASGTTSTTSNFLVDHSNDSADQTGAPNTSPAELAKTSNPKTAWVL